MGASKEKKKRIDAKNSGEPIINEREAEARRKNRKFKRTAIITVAALVVCLVVVLLLNSNFLYQKLTAVTVDGVNYSVADYNYFRSVSKNEIDQYFGGAENARAYVTEDMIEGRALESMKYATAYGKLASEAGYTLSDEAAESIDNSVKTLKLYADINKVSLDKYLSATFGTGVDEKVYRKNAELTALMSEYSRKLYEDIEYTDAELEEKYDPSKSDVISYYIFNASSALAKTATADDAKALAEEFASKVTDAASFEALTYEYAPQESKIYYKQEPKTSLRHDAAEHINEAYSEWLLDSARKSGDFEVFTDDDGAYVVYFVERSDNSYTPVSVRQIFFPHGVTYSDYLSDPEYEDAYNKAIYTAHTSAEEVLNTWKDGEMTEENFAYLAQTHNSSGDAGFIGVMQKGAYDEAVEAWCFDSSRKEGDTAVIDTPKGSYVLYFISEYPQTYRQYIADSELRRAEFSDFEQESVAGYEPQKTFGFRFAG